MRSLQRTLSLRYAATMLVALLVFGLWAYLGVRTALEGEQNATLLNAAVVVADAIGRGESLTAHAGLADSLSAGVRLVLIRDASGRVLQGNSGLATQLPLDSTALILARAGQPGWAVTELGGHRFRSVYVPGPSTSGDTAGRVAVVEVAGSMAPVEQAGRALLLRMLATALVGTALTWLGAAWLARLSLKPVAEIAAQARSIRSGGTAQQITVHADVVELQDLIAVLNGMLVRLDGALGDQRRILRDVGHELRTPITAIRGEVEIALRRERRAEEYRMLLGSILEEVDRLALMGDQLITLTRYETGDLAISRTPVNLAELIAGVVNQAHRRLVAHRVTLGEVSPELVWELDSNLIAVALAQLLENVVRHTPAGTEVVVTAERDADVVRLTVDDAGPGLAPEERACLFAPFYRPDPARTRGAGVGLGLSVVAAIVRLHGGTASATASPLGGLRIELTLPREVPAGLP